MNNFESIVAAQKLANPSLRDYRDKLANVFRVQLGGNPWFQFTKLDDKSVEQIYLVDNVGLILIMDTVTNQFVRMDNQAEFDLISWLLLDI
jgi:hypothetical protein